MSDSANLLPTKPIVFYNSRVTPSCRAVKMLATHLNIPLKEVYNRCYIDTRTEEFRKVSIVLPFHSSIVWLKLIEIAFFRLIRATHCL